MSSLRYFYTWKNITHLNAKLVLQLCDLGLEGEQKWP
jgi:hypothetical protein